MIFHFGSGIIFLFWSFLPFLSSFPSHHELEKVTFDDIDDGASFSSEI